MSKSRSWSHLPDDHIYLSRPSATTQDVMAVSEAVRSGWLSPNGPEVEAFEDALAAFLGVAGAVALSSGTAALHLGLKYLGVSAGDYVLVPTVTFGATAFAVAYLNAKPVFVDVDDSWNMDPELIRDAVKLVESFGGRITAAIPVDLYGTPANLSELKDQLNPYEIRVLEDAAEAIGAKSGDRFTGSSGSPAAFSFNGNKIITSSGGGMLVGDDLEMIDWVRYWASQARESVPWYEHVEVGYNYRLSNVLAALGRSQLTRLEDEVARRRFIRHAYAKRLNAVPGALVQTDPAWGESNAWLTIATFDAHRYPGAAPTIMRALDKQGIESRPIWKPMNQQPVFSGSPRVLSGCGDRLFIEGLCLPSGIDVTTAVVDRVSQVIEKELSLLAKA